MLHKILCIISECNPKLFEEFVFQIKLYTDILFAYADGDTLLYFSFYMDFVISSIGVTV